MSDTEQRYSQIEKEALAIMWTCEKFADYVVGKPIQLETNHIPLVPLLTTTSLDPMPPRVLQFWLHLSRFDYTISHVPGKLLYTADALSRAPVTVTNDSQHQDDIETEQFVQAVISSLPVSKDRLGEYRKI